MWVRAWCAIVTCIIIGHWISVESSRPIPNWTRNNKLGKGLQLYVGIFCSSSYPNETSPGAVQVGLTCRVLVWPSSTNWAVFYPAGCTETDSSVPSLNLQGESGALLRTASLHRPDYRVVCFVWDWETLCGKMSRGEGGCLREMRQTLWNGRIETELII